MTFYSWVLLVSVSGPVFFSFLPQIRFYRFWLKALISSLVVSLIFIPWDMVFTCFGVWGFNPAYHLNIYIGNLPLEEICFFLAIPFCSLFVYECVDAFTFFQKKWYKYRLSKTLLTVIGGLLFITFFYVRSLSYTASVVGATAVLILLCTWTRAYLWIEWGRFLLAYGIVTIPFFIVNGLLTYYPVVWYNNQENLAWRIGTIPVEDFLYQFVLFGLNILCFNLLKNKLI